MIFTKKDETADERIERLAKDLSAPLQNLRRHFRLYGTMANIRAGALRISARELLAEMESIEKNIKRQVEAIRSTADFQNSLKKKWRKFLKNGAGEKDERLTL